MSAPIPAVPAIPANPALDQLPRLSLGRSSTSSSRPSSHHRRQSSVSTRRESAEMMGIPSNISESSASDDVDTDTLRRRALWALEGRSSLTSPTSTSFLSLSGSVEIPDLSSSESDSLSDYVFKPSKRDSIGRALVPSLGPDERLQTLVEVDEDEDDEIQAAAAAASGQDRAAGLSAIVQPPKAPAPLQRPGLKPLTLATSPPLANATLPTSTQRVTQTAEKSKRRSSLSYKRSNEVSSPPTSISIAPFSNALPTPDMTPVTAERPLSPSEQAFLNNNHASLLSRITELERVLSVRTRSPSIATTSSRQLSVSSVASEPPRDEMLCLVRDLKAERDDLTRDIGVYQTRIEQLEKQIGILTRRIENERRDAWQARERVGVLEVEKRQLLSSLEKANAMIDELRESSRQARAAEEHTRSLLVTEHKRRESLEIQLQTLRSSGVARAGSPRSATTVPSVVFSLAAEPTIGSSESENELAHYEDEDENDLGVFSDDSYSESNTGSSFYTSLPTSYRVEPLALSSASLTRVPLPSPSSTASTTPPVTPAPYSQSSHGRRNSMEKSWSFPTGAQTAVKTAPEVDRFFHCLDISDTFPASPPPSAGFKDKYGFFNDDDDDDESPPFIIPTSLEPPSAFGRLDATAVTPSPTLRRKPVPRCEADSFPISPVTSSSIDSFSDTSDHASQVLDIPSIHKSPALTPRRQQPSSIPKLTTSPQRKGSHLATPTSIPRAKSIQDAAVQGKRLNIPPSINTPTKPPSSRVSNGLTHFGKLLTLDAMGRGRGRKSQIES